MFHGSIPALVTPFRDNTVDEAAYRELIERQIAGGSAAVVPVGTTGESATLTHEEHRRAVSVCLDTVRGRVPVIAGCGSNATHEAIGLVEFAKAEGADAALVVCPYYNRPDQEGLYQHFRAIADTVALPIIIYNVPARTSSDIQPATVGRLAEHPNIVGIKDATGDMSRVTLHRNLCGEEFCQLSGDDPTTLAYIAAGGVGAISVTANVVPEAVSAMHAAMAAGDLIEARRIEGELIDLHKTLFLSPSPGPAKYALSAMGLCSEELRLPLVGPGEAVREKVDAAVKRALEAV
jgi:4-hydroxy-tetrahydrodipicolinate synthase